MPTYISRLILTRISFRIIGLGSDRPKSEDTIGIGGIRGRDDSTKQCKPALDHNLTHTEQEGFEIKDTHHGRC